MRLFGVGPVLGFQLKSDYEGAQAAVLAEVIRIVRVHCAHPRGAVGVALAALLAQAALLAGLLVQQAFLALLAGRVAIDAVDDAGIIVVHALVHRTEAGVTQRAVHRVTVIVCTVIAEAAGVADGYGAAGALMAFAAQLVILADVALGAGGAVRFLHALRALVALIAPVGRVAQAQTAVVAMGLNPAIVVGQWCRTGSRTNSHPSGSGRSWGNLRRCRSLPRRRGREPQRPARGRTA